jgi:hypothetical protein
MEQETEGTRTETIEEIARLKARLAELEERLAPSRTGSEDGRERGWVECRKRREFQAEIEFIGDFDIVHARGIDVSEGGIGFEVAEELPFEMQFELDGKPHRHRARLAWMKRLPDGHYRLGFEFIVLPSGG